MLIEGGRHLQRRQTGPEGITDPLLFFRIHFPVSLHQHRSVSGKEQDLIDPMASDIMVDKPAVTSYKKPAVYIAVFVFPGKIAKSVMDVTVHQTAIETARYQRHILRPIGCSSLIDVRIMVSRKTVAASLIKIRIQLIAHVDIRHLLPHVCLYFLVKAALPFGCPAVRGDKTVFHRFKTAAIQKFPNPLSAKIHIGQRRQTFPLPLQPFYYLQEIRVPAAASFFHLPFRRHSRFPVNAGLLLQYVPDFLQGNLAASAFFHSGLFFCPDAKFSKIRIIQRHSHQIKQIGRPGNTAQDQSVKHVEGYHIKRRKTKGQTFRRHLRGQRRLAASGIKAFPVSDPTFPIRCPTDLLFDIPRRTPAVFHKPFFHPLPPSLIPS